MIDEEINNIAKNGDHYFLLGYFISFKDFIISTYGSVPININLRGGYCLYEVMQIYQNQCLTNKPTIQKKAQFITDMYKLCLHENLDKDIDD